MTFRAARDNHLAYLKSRGWDVKTWGPQGILKVPHATSPDGRVRLYFHAQAVHKAEHDLSAKNARSVWLDIRKTNPEKFEEYVLQP